jgi:hypothetical protein
VNDETAPLREWPPTVQEFLDAYKTCGLKPTTGQWLREEERICCPIMALIAADDKIYKWKELRGKDFGVHAAQQVLVSMGWRVGLHEIWEFTEAFDRCASRSAVARALRVALDI